ncbi:hypothetical protein QJQ45_026808 [Haematococcus lacustris]|nr:hypothetical protein QJQ45_026808 [Haematococcus lacustris]
MFCHANSTHALSQGSGNDVGVDLDEMAFAVRQPAPQLQEENAMLAKDSKANLTAKSGQSLLQQGSKRRAPLGDMSNLVAPLGNRTATAKDGAKAVDPAAKPRSATVRTAAKEPAVAAVPTAPNSASGRAVQPAAPPSAPGTGLLGVAPRTRSQTAMAARQQAGMSMSSLLQSRSEAAVSSKKPVAPASPLPDIDSEDRNNPLAATEYVNDIYSYYRRIEPKYRVSAAYMASQADINEKMRAILVDWLVEVHLKFKLMPETLYLTVNIIDRYLELKPVTRRNLQLVGVTAMLIACKYEEIWAPEVRDFVYISDKAYTREQILAMEKVVLNTLHFNLTLPTPYNFLARFLKAAGAHLDKQVTMLASYLSELAMVDAAMLKHSYSITSAAALYVAMRTLGKAQPYPKALARHSGYTEEAVLPCAKQLVALMQKAPSASLTAVYKKYSHAKFLEISKTLVCTAILEEENELLHLEVCVEDVAGWELCSGKQDDSTGERLCGCTATTAAMMLQPPHPVGHSGRRTPADRPPTASCSALHTTRTSVADIKFRPCIDIHKGKVKQIVGSTLVDLPGERKEEELKTNFVSDKPSSWYAQLYRNDGLAGGHVIMLGSDDASRATALEALSAWPGGLQMGGGVTADNAMQYLDAGASHVIVTSYVFREGRLEEDRLAQLVKLVGRSRLVLDLSCRQRDGQYWVVTDRWQRFSQLALSQASLAHLAQSCDEFLVHGVDVEGMQLGIDEGLVQLLGQWAPIPVTYAGGARTLEDLERVRGAGQGRVDITVGSALDIFGGQLPYKDHSQVALGAISLHSAYADSHLRRLPRDTDWDRGPSGWMGFMQAMQSGTSTEVSEELAVQIISCVGGTDRRVGGTELAVQIISCVGGTNWKLRLYGAQEKVFKSYFKKPCEEELDRSKPTRPEVWKPPAACSPRWTLPSVAWRPRNQAWSQPRDDPGLCILVSAHEGLNWVAEVVGTAVLCRIWSAKHGHSKLLLCLPHKKLFVLLVYRDHSDRTCASHSSRVGASLRVMVEQVLEQRNPFTLGSIGTPDSASSSSSSMARVVALEIQWSDLQMADAQHYYNWSPGSAAGSRSPSCLTPEPSAHGQALGPTHTQPSAHASWATACGGPPLLFRQSAPDPRCCSTHPSTHPPSSLACPPPHAPPHPATHPQGDPHGTYCPEPATHIHTGSLREPSALSLAASQAAVKHPSCGPVPRSAQGLAGCASRDMGVAVQQGLYVPGGDAGQRVAGQGAKHRRRRNLGAGIQHRSHGALPSLGQDHGLGASAHCLDQGIPCAGLRRKQRSCDVEPHISLCHPHNPAAAASAAQAVQAKEGPSKLPTPPAQKEDRGLIQGPSTQPLPGPTPSLLASVLTTMLAWPQALAAHVLPHSLTHPLPPLPASLHQPPTCPLLHRSPLSTVDGRLSPRHEALAPAATLPSAHAPGHTLPLPAALVPVCSQVQQPSAFGTVAQRAFSPDLSRHNIFNCVGAATARKPASGRGRAELQPGSNSRTESRGGRMGGLPAGASAAVALAPAGPSLGPWLHAKRGDQAGVTGVTSVTDPSSVMLAQSWEEQWDQGLVNKQVLGRLCHQAPQLLQQHPPPAPAASTCGDRQGALSAPCTRPLSRRPSSSSSRSSSPRSRASAPTSLTSPGLDRHMSQVLGRAGQPTCSNGYSLAYITRTAPSTLGTRSHSPTGGVTPSSCTSTPLEQLLCTDQCLEGSQGPGGIQAVAALPKVAVGGHDWSTRNPQQLLHPSLCGGPSASSLMTQGSDEQQIQYCVTQHLPAWLTSLPHPLQPPSPCTAGAPHSPPGSARAGATTCLPALHKGNARRTGPEPRPEPGPAAKPGSCSGSGPGTTARPVPAPDHEPGVEAEPGARLDPGPGLLLGHGPGPGLGFEPGAVFGCGPPAHAQQGSRTSFTGFHLALPQQQQGRSPGCTQQGLQGALQQQLGCRHASGVLLRSASCSRHAVDENCHSMLQPNPDSIHTTGDTTEVRAPGRVAGATVALDGEVNAAAAARSQEGGRRLRQLSDQGGSSGARRRARRHSALTLLQLSKAAGRQDAAQPTDQQQHRLGARPLAWEELGSGFKLGGQQAQPNGGTAALLGAAASQAQPRSQSQGRRVPGRKPRSLSHHACSQAQHVCSDLHQAGSQSERCSTYPAADPHLTLQPGFECRTQLGPTRCSSPPAQPEASHPAQPCPPYLLPSMPDCPADPLARPQLQCRVPEASTAHCALGLPACPSAACLATSPAILSESLGRKSPILAPPPRLAGQVPAAARWTAASAVFTSRTVIMQFRDPHVPPMLRDFVKSDMRLLKLYESGLPSWAVFLPCYGLWYRPWMRTATWLLVTAISIFSMAMGFYGKSHLLPGWQPGAEEAKEEAEQIQARTKDLSHVYLYKNVPLVRQAMATLSARLFPSAHRIVEWLERHAQVRLSILFTYVFSKSPLFISLMRLLRSAMGLLTQSLMPVGRAAQTLVAPVVSSLAWATASVAASLQPLVSTCLRLLEPIASLTRNLVTLLLGLVTLLSNLAALLLGPPCRLLWWLLVAGSHALLLLLQLGKVLLAGPLLLAKQLACLATAAAAALSSQLQFLSAGMSMMGSTLKAGSKVFSRSAPAVKAAGRALSSARTTVAAASQALPLSGLSAAAASAAHAASPGLNSGAATSLHSSWLLVTWLSQEVGLLLDFFRNTLFRCVKALQAVVNCFIAMGLILNRHRVSLMMQSKRFLLTGPRRRYLPRAVAQRLASAPSIALLPGLPPEALAAAAAAGMLDSPEPPTPRGRVPSHLDLAVSNMEGLRASMDNRTSRLDTRRGHTGDTLVRPLTDVSPTQRGVVYDGWRGLGHCDEME